MNRWFFSLLLLAACHGVRPGATDAFSAVGGEGSKRLNMERQSIARLLGDQDALLAADPAGKTVVSIRADRMLVPASTLKILTALIARHYLGTAFRFKTEFYLDDRNNLKIKGYGDPLLISEVIRNISATMAERIHVFNDLIVDGSWFGAVAVPGITDTLNPYDAPNGALAVNFNTVNFIRLSEHRYVSAEPQTPLLPFILDRIRQSGRTAERIVLSAEKDEAMLYAGHLFRHFLRDAGVRSRGKVKSGVIRPGQDRMVYRYDATYSLDEIIRQLLMYSNNYIANQLLISAGIAVHGPPGTLEKGILAADDYIRTVLKRRDIRMVEGSGISRENRITAACMMKILEAFAPLHDFMREDGGIYYKTGSLTGVKTRVGYVRGKDGSLSPFVLILNTPNKSVDPVMSRLAGLLEQKATR